MRCSGMACLLGELWLERPGHWHHRGCRPGTFRPTTLFPLVSAFGLGLRGVGILPADQLQDWWKPCPGGVVERPGHWRHRGRRSGTFQSKLFRILQGYGSLLYNLQLAAVNEPAPVPAGTPASRAGGSRTLYPHNLLSSSPSIQHSTIR